MTRHSSSNASTLSRMRRSRLHLASLSLVLGLLANGESSAQATTGSIYGRIEAAQSAGLTVRIQGNAGFVRNVPVDDAGRYSVGSLPVGSYTVSLVRDGQTLHRYDDVVVRVNSGSEVSFGLADGAVSDLGTVTVTASRSAALDVSSVDSRTVVTDKELAYLPIAQSAEAIALLAPNVVSGTTAQFAGKHPGGESMLSFGGASITENAYYVNGLNTTDPIGGFGGIALPYGAIAQQEVLTGGYGAAYGRSAGGVINQVGKRGGDDWSFGFRAEWTPERTREALPDIYYPTGSGAATDGTLYQRRSAGGSSSTRFAAYAGGPVVADRLYFFGAVETESSDGNTVGPTTGAFDTHYSSEKPKAYAKLDWNISDNHLLELTGLTYRNKYWGDNYLYSYATDETGRYSSPDTTSKVQVNDWVAKYTGYVGDDLTLSAMYGRQRLSRQQFAPGASDKIYIFNPTQQNYAVTPTRGPINSPVALTYEDVDQVAGSSNLRLELNWRLGRHSLTVGIDNQDTYDDNDDRVYRGGHYWYYARDTSGRYLVGSPGAETWVAPVPAGQGGYHVRRVVYSRESSVSVEQRAQYIEDNWQATDNLLLSLGLRNDQFTNYNDSGSPYVSLTKPQWAPRLGFSWDAKGDSSLRLYGNAGRYYLAMPAVVGVIAASGLVSTSEYFTYTSIDADGVPHGLQPIASSTGGPVSTANLYGASPDPATVSASNLSAQHQDEFILGVARQFGPDWVAGAKATYRTLRNAIDNQCETAKMSQIASEQLGRPINLAGLGYSCLLFNPGRTNEYRVPNGTGRYDTFAVSSEQLGFPDVRRTYKSLEMFLERPMRDRWSGKLSYVWSQLKGNAEGQVNTFTGQSDVSLTRDWDYAELSEYAYGYLPNDRKHQLKLYGVYEVTPEIRLGANLLVASGTPQTCLGFYGENEANPNGYGSFYHWCAGEPAPTGAAGRNPWQQILSLNLDYRPKWADGRLSFGAMAYNVFNQVRTTQTYSLYGRTGALNSSYGRVLSTTTPRYLRFSVSYDF